MFTQILQHFTGKNSALRDDDVEPGYTLISNSFEQDNVSKGVQTAAQLVTDGGHCESNCDDQNASIPITSKKKQCLLASFPSLLILAIVLISLVLGRQYVVDVLIYIDSLALWQSMIIFFIMYTLVAFPIIWGYTLLNVASGYIFGFVYGTLMTSACAAYAIIFSHFIVHRFCKGYVQRVYIVNAQTRLLMELVAGSNGYKIVFLTRFTPIPFGIQNAIFAVSGIKIIPYWLSSVSALLVTQSVYSYMGSTFRSIAQVLSNKNSATTWVILCTQVLITIGLTAFIVYLAKRQLKKDVAPRKASALTVDEGTQTSDPSHVALATTVSNNNYVARAKSHSRNLSVNIPPIGGYSFSNASATINVVRES